MRNGTLNAITAFSIWGILPLYWNELNKVSTLEILCHRIIWSLVFLIIILLIKKEWNGTLNNFKSTRTKFVLTCTSLLIGCSWATYIYAINNNYIIEASLGYFISPFVYIFLGVIVLKERLRIFQCITVCIAFIGLIHMTFIYGKFPFIAILLASSFGLYGLIRKRYFISAIEGLTFEMIVLFFPAIIYLNILRKFGTISFGKVDSYHTLLLLLSGAVTMIPLMLFINSSKKIPMYALGVMQYITPTCIFIIGIFFNREEFNQSRLLGFIIIWIALLSYTLDGVLHHKRLRSRST